VITAGRFFSLNIIQIIGWNSTVKTPSKKQFELIPFIYETEGV
jgi:hypothetical protein